eukprot:TRINITY_DN10787_c0_g1_i2.p1 TRINITY_DN10787_c0_g1~~TRINITY_DN10787_c0_g1_i2.p1  ORF type:complete len:108 (-),score=15.74 TRINITY_DN10787_c0_g1_i2:59-382(-)
MGIGRIEAERLTKESRIQKERALKQVILRRRSVSRDLSESKLDNSVSNASSRKRRELSVAIEPGSKSQPKSYRLPPPRSGFLHTKMMEEIFPIALNSTHFSLSLIHI